MNNFKSRQNMKTNGTVQQNWPFGMSPCKPHRQPKSKATNHFVGFQHNPKQHTMMSPQANLLLSQVQNHQQQLPPQSLQQISSSSFQNVPSLIKCQPEISLCTTKVVSSKGEIHLHTVLVRRNGSPYLVGEQCRQFFQTIIFKSERIDYFLKSYKEYFKICLNISICPQEPSPILQLFLVQEIQTILKQSQKYLVLAGLLKPSSKISLSNIKNTLQLKKQFVKALLQKRQQDESSRTPSCQFSPEPFDIETVEIEENVQNLSERKLQARKGGYFTVQEMICKVTKPDGRTSQMVLAKKKVRDDRKQNVDAGKMFRQLQLVRKIKNRKYLLDYYLVTNDQTCFYMNFVAQSLKDLVHGQILSMIQRFDLAHQLIQAISFLHQSNIVHRDLKLENILVETDEGLRVRVIDFGESQYMDKSSKDDQLGCTPPYSPLECLSFEEQSHNRPAIDYWSIVIIIYELTFKTLPFYYNRSIQSELVNGWRTEGDFSIFLRFRRRKGFWKIEEMLNLFTEQGLRMRQSERVNLQQMGGMIKAIEGYYQRLKQQIGK